MTPSSANQAANPLHHRHACLLRLLIAACLALSAAQGRAAPAGYVPNSFAEGGQTYSVTAPIDVSAPYAGPQSVYQSEVYGQSLAYTIPVPAPPAGKTYTVRLHFAELYDTGAGRRVMNVTLNGRKVLSGFDVFAQAGAKYKAVVKEYTGVMPSPEGTITLEFTAAPGHQDANAAVNGIEILGNGFTRTDPPIPTNLPFQNPALPAARRVDDLLSRLTRREKVAQMRFTAPGIPRLGISAYNWWNEALHGVGRAGTATVFPQAIGLAATWDTALHYRTATVISDEARAKYNDAVAHGNHGQYYGLDFWSPNINIFRDPRWGRGQETYGEDPFLTGRRGVYSRAARRRPAHAESGGDGETLRGA